MGLVGGIYWMLYVVHATCTIRENKRNKYIEIKNKNFPCKRKIEGDSLHKVLGDYRCATRKPGDQSAK